MQFGTYLILGVDEGFFGVFLVESQSVPVVLSLVSTFREAEATWWPMW